jgi:hypothetical protein
VRATLNGQTLDRYLDRYLTVWAQSPDVPVADVTSSQSAMNQPGVPGQKKFPIDIDCPTAASIPPISIMNPEPKGPVTATAPAAVAAGAATADVGSAGPPSSPAKRPRKQAASAPAQAVAPVPAAPAPVVDPVWGPGTGQSVPQAATTAASGPVQLNPALSPAQPGAGTTRTQ